MDYQIQAGDTLSSIAAKHGTSVAALLAANPNISNANAIRAGAALSIPVGQANATSTITKQPVNTGGVTAPSIIPKVATAAPVTTPTTNTGSGKTFTPVTLGNGTTVYSDQQGNFYTSTGQPVSNASIATSTAGSAPMGTTGGAAASSGGITVTPTGDPALDQVLGAIKGVADGLVSTGYTLPANLQITPQLVSDFTAYAHQAIDPYTQQLLTARLADVNASLSNTALQYQNSVGQTEQDFGTNLASEQNAAGNSGTAFSGLRALGENNMAASTNRTLSSLGSQAATDLGTEARAGAADVGSANAGGIVLPSLATGSVSLAGGSRGSSAAGGPLALGYDPSIYTVGNIPSAQTAAVNAQAANYLSQYGTLANANSGRSMSDLVGSLSGLPANYVPPTNLT